MASKAGHWRRTAVVLTSSAFLLSLEGVAPAAEASTTCAYRDPHRGDRERTLDVDTVTVSRTDSNVITFTVGVIEHKPAPTPGFEIRIDTDSDRFTGDADGADVLLTSAQGSSGPNPGLRRWQQGTWKTVPSRTLRFAPGHEQATFRIGADELPNAAFAFQVAAGGRWLQDDDDIDIAPTENTASMFVSKAPDQWTFPKCGVLGWGLGHAWRQLRHDLEGGGYVYVLAALLVVAVGTALAVTGWMIDRSRKPSR